MPSFIDQFAEERAISWHPSKISIIAVNNETQRASEFDSGFRTSVVGMERICSAVITCVWSPIVWKTGKRLSANFSHSDFAALDFDESDYTLADALNDWSDTVHIIATTKSHQIEKGGKPSKDRFRLIVPWVSRVTSLEVYRYNMTRLIKRYDADPSCKDGARFFWPCIDVVSLNTSGYLQPIYTPPVRSPSAVRAKADSLRDRKSLPGKIIRIMRQPFPSGQRNSLCFDCAKYLVNAGYDPTECFDVLSKLVGPDFYDELTAAIANAAHSVKEGLAFGRSNSVE